MDRRMQKTQTAIYMAFNRLLSTRSYARITVSDIIEEANIGRSTFYAHYETKEDLLREICQQTFEHVVHRGLTGENQHDFSNRDLTLPDVIAHILYHIKEETQSMKGLFIGDNGEYFWHNFREQADTFIRMYFAKELKDRNGLPEDLLVNHLSVTFEGMVKYWIRNGLKESPEQMASYYLMLVHLKKPADLEAEAHWRS